MYDVPILNVSLGSNTVPDSESVIRPSLKREYLLKVSLALVVRNLW